MRFAMKNELSATILRNAHVVTSDSKAAKRLGMELLR
jgi:hypothetical protein